jgi:hypothetical protein
MSNLLGLSKNIKRNSKKSIDKIIKRREYDNARFRNLKYNDFKDIDFVDVSGREYKFNKINKEGTIPYDRELNEPPTILTDKFAMSSSDLRDDLSQKKFGNISLSLRLPTKNKINKVPKDILFPSPDSQKIYLFNENTGVVCYGKSTSIFYGSNSKTAEIILSDFKYIGNAQDRIDFTNQIQKL